METTHFDIGMAMASAALGVPVEEVIRKKASVNTVENHKVYGYGAIQRLVCKYAAEAYRESGQMEKFAYHMYSQLAKTAQWWPVLDPYYEAAVAALGKVHGSIRKEAADLQTQEVFSKEAAMARNVMSGLLKISPDVIKTVLAGGTIAGVGGGSLAWLANRNVEEDEPKIEAMKEKIKYYNRLSGEIESQLANRRSPASRKEVEDIVNNII
jgi:hypothetical protein